MSDRPGQDLWSVFSTLIDRLGSVFLRLFVLLFLVALGLAIAWVARWALTRIARVVGFDRHMERLGVGGALRRSGILRTPSDTLGTLCFWAIFILFASLGIDSLGLGESGATHFLVAFLPPLFAAVLILIVGWLVANFVSQGLLIAAVNAGVPQARLLPAAAHWGVVLSAGATALPHLGIGKEMLLVAFGITFGGLVFALALAFGLGGRILAQEILSRRLRRESPPPQERLTHL